MGWFEHGDRNTKFFHAYVKGRSKMQIQEITTDLGDTLGGSMEIGQAAVEHFKNQFKEAGKNQDFSLFQHIPNLIPDEDNIQMTEPPRGSRGQGGYNGSKY